MILTTQHLIKLLHQVVVSTTVGIGIIASAATAPISTNQPHSELTDSTGVVIHTLHMFIHTSTKQRTETRNTVETISSDRIRIPDINHEQIDNATRSTNPKPQHEVRLDTNHMTATDNESVTRSGGINLAPAGRITLIKSTADLPFTIVNNQPMPVTVAIKLTSDTVRFLDGDRSIVRLEPGRNLLSIQAEVTTSGDNIVEVSLTTPDTTNPIVLSNGYQHVRFAKLSGIGTLISVCSVLSLALWWARTWRYRRMEAATYATINGQQTDNNPTNPIDPKDPI